MNTIFGTCVFFGIKQWRKTKQFCSNKLFSLSKMPHATVPDSAANLTQADNLPMARIFHIAGQSFYVFYHAASLEITLGITGGIMLPVVSLWGMFIDLSLPFCWKHL